ncbi:MAG: hypothetical protein WCV92_00125 [Candidatus Buchananbacteria bacterium]
MSNVVATERDIQLISRLYEEFEFEGFTWITADEAINCYHRGSSDRGEVVTNWTQPDLESLIALGWLRFQPVIDEYSITDEGVREVQCGP